MILALLLFTTYPCHGPEFVCKPSLRYENPTDKKEKFDSKYYGNLAVTLGRILKQHPQK